MRLHQGDRSRRIHINISKEKKKVADSEAFEYIQKEEARVEMKRVKWILDNSYSNNHEQIQVWL